MILVVDDDSFSTRALTLLLRHLGETEVVCVTNGDDALDVIESRHAADAPIDACLMDVHLEGEKGYDVTCWSNNVCLFCTRADRPTDRPQSRTRLSHFTIGSSRAEAISLRRRRRRR